MQLIQRASLFYQSGTSDKVYEVDLCQVAPDRYMVNYRYGRRGKTLREGAETVTALPLDEAQKAFDRLVRSKVSKGYQEASTVAPEIISTPHIIDPDARDRVILARLALAINNPQAVSQPTEWKLDRVIWRSGELQLMAAAPLLMQLWGDNNLRNYSIAWSLGNCEDEAAIPMLEQVYREQNTPAHVRRIALEAIFKLSSVKREELRIELIAQLPEQLRELIQIGSTTDLIISSLLTYLPIVSTDLFNDDKLEQEEWDWNDDDDDDRDTQQVVIDVAELDRFEILDIFYQIDNEYTRPVILKLVRTAPLEPNYFKRLRHIFKIAEYRQDAEVFGILAYRFEQSPEFYTNSSYGIYIPNGGRYLELQNWEYDPQTSRYIVTKTEEFETEMAKSDCRLAYSSKTRDYLLRRIWRSLKKLGESNRSTYVQMATEVLLQYHDDDAEPVRESSYYRYDNNWQRVENNRISWDRYAAYLAFNHILYSNSPRYELKSGAVWRCKSTYKLGDPAPHVREEAFPELWTQQPELLLKLLCNSQCQPVHEFAVKAIETCSEFCQELSIDTLIQLLAKPYEVTARLGFELARSRYQPDNPQFELVLAIANCAYAPARTEAHEWIRNQVDRFLSDDLLIAALIISPEPDTQLFIRQLLGTIIITNLTAQIIIGRSIAGLLILDLADVEVAANATITILTCFRVALRSIGLEIVLDLLRHPLPLLQTFGAEILLNHQTATIDLPPGLIDALIESPVESVRVIGVQLFGQLPDKILLDRIELILTLAMHELPEMRSAIRSSIHRLAAAHPNFTSTLVAKLLPILLAPEQHEGLHNFLSQLLQADLPNWMEVTSPETTWTLLKSSATASQDLAGRILQANSNRWAETLTTEKIAELTYHEILAVRESGWQMSEQVLPRLRNNPADLLAATTIVGSKWEDSRKFGFKLFGELLQPAELTPAVVISICDSNRDDVRKFGRDLVGSCFQARDGLEYLLKFSEHPATDMQLFASQYLEDYAADNLGRLQELMPYFVRVLAQVNRARVAKQRIFAFLTSEAIKSESAAKLIVEVLTRQSVSIAIIDRTHALETLLKIHQLYPNLSVPITVKPLPIKT
jgi:predicted DNA-binding WGR domain protein